MAGHGLRLAFATSTSVEKWRRDDEGTRVAKLREMRPSTRSVAFCTWVSFAAISLASSARASTGWMANGDVAPIEQRIAIAAGPTRTVVWTSLRYQGDAAVALVVPAADGASVDLASDAWFEALESNTAPRVVPPKGGEACPGASSFPTFDVIGDLEHRRTTAPDEVTVLADAQAVDAWAAARGLDVDAGMDAAMRALAPMEFVVLAFPAKASGATTATVRVTTDASDARVPLSLTHATGDDLVVTAYFLGEARASLVPETPATIAPAALTWFAASGRSSYRTAREQALVASNETVLTESAGHDGLGKDRTFSGFEQIDGLVHTYMDRGAAYDPGAFDLATCEESAEHAFSRSAPVGKSCPAGELATIGTPAGCEESAEPGTTPPDALRCGTALDDLAIGLSGMSPAKVWLTRETLLVESGHGGLDLTLALADGSVVSSVITAAVVDDKGCSTSSGAGNGNGSGHGHGSGINGNGNGNGSGDIDLGDDGSDDDGGDSCGSSDSGSDSCDGGGDGDSCDSSGGDSCDSGGGDACGSGAPSSCNCAFGRKTKPRGSIVLMATVALAALFRRRGSKKRRTGEVKRAAG